MLNFTNFKVLTVGTVKTVELSHHAKFRWNRPKRGRDIAIYRFFKMAAAAILYFKNFKFLKFGTVKRVDLRYHTKYRWNRSNRGRDIVIIRFFEMAAAAILDFRNFKFFNGRTRHEWRTASLCQISSKSLETQPRYVSFNVMLVWLENA